jgi:hypothetical protein
MKFGILKTLVETKLTESYKNSTFEKEFLFFKKNILSNNDFKKKMFIYDKLNENVGIDKDSANFLVETLFDEIKKIKNNRKLETQIIEWTKNLKINNNYEVIDNFIYSPVEKIDLKLSSRKQIIESLTKTKKKNQYSIPQVGFESFINLANKNVNKLLESLSEGEKNKIKDVLKNTGDLQVKFQELKESVVSKIDTLIENSEKDLLQTLTETKNKVSNTEFSKIEYIKLMSLNEGLS